jgi:hypothetical protein
MNKGIIILLAIFAVVLFFSCGPLEGSEVIGPAGGYVFYDKGSYSGGWRYLESPPEDAGRLSGESGAIDFAEALKLADEFSYGGYHDWRLPTDDEFNSLFDYFLKGSLVNDRPPDNGGIRFSDTTFYLTSDNHAFSCKTNITTNSEGKKEWHSEIVQGKGMYESGCEYLVHPIRSF